MLTYVWRQELVPLLAMDPVLHYYPLLSCYQELRAPATAWKDGEGNIRGGLLPCDSNGGAWIVAASIAAASALIEEVPPEMPVTIPLWADSAVREMAPHRRLTTQAIAVCTLAELRQPDISTEVTLGPLESPPGVQDSLPLVPPLRSAHLGCTIDGSLAGFCTYQVDGRGGGSIERLVVYDDWIRADIGKTMLAAAALEILQESERVIFAGPGENQASLGVAARVGFRVCYWLKIASPVGKRDE